MKRLNAGAGLLSLWAGLNLLLALGILTGMALGKNPPSVGMVFSDADLPSLDPRALGLIKALAVLFNACAAGLCGLALTAVWKGVVPGLRWALWAVGASMGLVQAAGFWSDGSLGHHNVAATASRRWC